MNAAKIGLGKWRELRERGASFGTAKKQCAVMVGSSLCFRVQRFSLFQQQHPHIGKRGRDQIWYQRCSRWYISESLCGCRGPLPPGGSFDQKREREISNPFNGDPLQPECFPHLVAADFTAIEMMEG